MAGEQIFLLRTGSLLAASVGQSHIFPNSHRDAASIASLHICTVQGVSSQRTWMQAGYTAACNPVPCPPRPHQEKPDWVQGCRAMCPVQTFPQTAASHMLLKMPGESIQNFRIIYIFAAQLVSKQSSNFGPNSYILTPTTLPFVYLFP